MNVKVRNMIRKLIVYISGMFMIALGVNISKLAALGMAPVSSIPGACEAIWGFTLGTSTFIVYIFLILAQLVILRRNFRLTNALGLVLTVFFSLLVDFTGSDPTAFGHILYHFPVPGSYPVRLLYLAASVIIIGIGVFLYLRPHWVSLPSEGLAGAISTTTGIRFGNCKTLVDTSLVTIALILQLIFLGGLHSFVGDHVIVREGSIISAIFIGQIAKFLANRWAKPVENWLQAGEFRED